MQTGRNRPAETSGLIPLSFRPVWPGFFGPIHERISQRFRPAIRGPFRCKYRKEHRKRGPDRHDPRLGARVPGKECQELDDVPGRMEPLEIAGARKGVDGATHFLHYTCVRG